MKNIFLVGHGFLIEDLAKKFIVPANIYITFYCKKALMFDSKWEPEIVNIIEEDKVVSRCPTPQGDKEDDKEWEITRVKPFTRIEDHLLTRPGNLKTTAKKDSCLNIKTKGLAFECSGIEGVLEDNSFAAIKENNDADAVCVRLSSIIRALRKKDESNVLHLHWLACRTLLRDNTASAISQAKQSVSWDTDPAPPDRIGSIVRQNSAERAKHGEALGNFFARKKMNL